MPICRKYNAQKVIIPPKGENIVQFNEQHKGLEHPVVIFC